MVEFLVKIQKREHIFDMFQNEYIYFSVFKEFRNRSKDVAGRYDPREGNLRNEQLQYLKLQTETGLVIEFTQEKNKLNAQLMEHLSEPKMNICSFLRLNFNDQSQLMPLSDNLLGLGDTALIIGDKESFFEILDESLENNNYDFSRGPVTYYDPRLFNGDLSLMHKDVSYEFQQEYRVLIGPAGITGLSIPLPGLKKLCLVVEVENLHKLQFKRNTDVGYSLGFDL